MHEIPVRKRMHAEALLLCLTTPDRDSFPSRKSAMGRGTYWKGKEQSPARVEFLYVILC